MKRLAIVVVCLTLSLSLLGTGCSDSEDEPPPASGDQGASLAVGALLPLTGALASYGETSDAALEEAVTALREEGTNVDLLIEDTATDPATALDALVSLQEEGVRLVIGPYSSAEVRAVKDFADKNGIILISPLSTARSLAVPDDNVIRFTPDDEQEGIAVANLAWSDGIRTMVPITRDDEGNRGLQSAMKAAFEGLGGTVGPTLTYAAGEEDFSDEARALAERVSQVPAGSGPAGIYLTAFAEVTKLFGAAAGSPELESVDWYGSDSVALSKELVENETAAAFATKAGYPNPILGLREADREVWGPVSQRLTDRLGRTPDAFALAAYDALIVGVEALGSAGDAADAAALRQAVVAAAQEHTGLTGPSELNDAGDRSLGNYDFWAVCTRGTAFEWVRVATYTAGADGGAGEANREEGC